MHSLFYWLKKGEKFFENEVIEVFSSSDWDEGLLWAPYVPINWASRIKCKAQGIPVTSCGVSEKRTWSRFWRSYEVPSFSICVCVSVHLGSGSCKVWEKFWAACTVGKLLLLSYFCLFNRSKMCAVEIVCHDGSIFPGNTQGFQIARHRLTTKQARFPKRALPNTGF